MLLQTMATKGVERIETLEGAEFDPNTMEAMTTVPCSGDEAKPGTIANIWQVRGPVACVIVGHAWCGGLGAGVNHTDLGQA